jgi:hypothetical protein
MEHDTEFDLTLESILEEYRGFDPEAPEATPMPEAAFLSRSAEAELIDAGPEELLTPEDLLALEEEDPEPEEVLPSQEPEEATDADLFEAGDLEDILTGLHSEELDEILAEIRQEPEPEPEYDVRAYYPHGQEPEPESEPEAYNDYDAEAAEPETPMAKLRGFARRFAEVLAPEEEEPSEAEEEETLLFETEAPIDPEQQTQVFQAVAETFGEDLTVELPEEEAKIWAQEIGDGETQYAEALPEDEYEDEEDVLFGEAPEPDIPAPEEDWSGEDEDELYEEVERRSFEDAVVRPIVGRIAAISWRLRERREEKKEAEAEEEDLGPEPTARAAHRYYAAKESNLQTRSRLALVVSLVLLYLSSGLPVLGLLKNSPRVMAVMCIILQLTAMLIGLDVLTAGLAGFKHRRPGIESLVLLGCGFSLIDAALSAAFNSLENGLPFCVVSAFAVTFLLYSSFCRARGFGLTFHVLSRSKEPGVLTAGLNDYYDGITLTKSKCSTDGFVFRAEEPGPDAVVFAVLTPYLIAVCAILSLLATALSGSIKNAGHIFAAIFAAAAPLAAIICYTVPFKSLAAFLQPKGLAVAGWSGAGDISRSRRFVVTDRDLFAPNTISISDPSFLQGMSEAKVVAYAASLINASGCCLTPAFVELLSGYNYPLFRVEGFRCDSAGGMSGTINDEEVLLGTSEFMRLKGINASRPDIEDHTTLFVSINNELCGSFPVHYHAARSVQNALKYLLRSSERPVFAVRDPNIAPSLLKQKFRTQADGFDFPPFRQRYALSEPDLGEEDPICGVVTRTGLAALLTITKTGRQLCRYVNAGLVASLLLMVIGVLVMFWLCSVGLFATGSAFHLTVYELVAALIVPLVCYFIKR